MSLLNPVMQRRTPASISAGRSSTVAQKLMWLMVSLIALPALTACVSQPEVRVDPELLYRSRLDELSQLMEQERPLEAIALIDRLDREEPRIVSELSEQESEAYEQLMDIYDAALSEGAWRDALRYYDSLAALGRRARVQDLVTIRLGLADAALAEDNNVAALNHFLALLRDLDAVASDADTQSDPLLNDETIERFTEIAQALNHRDGAATIRGYLARRSQVIPDQLAELADGRDALSSMLTGTATVWVDRGITIQDGVGRPDRVVGSGFFIDPRGYLITNYHVIASEVDPEWEGVSRVFVRPPGEDSLRIPAEVVGYDRLFDVALLRVNYDPGYVFSFTDIRELDAGTQVFSLGSPGGLDSTITSGIISASGRRFLQLGDAMQIDAAINPGNSGGPLVNAAGRLIGLVFAGIELFEGVNFAIPSFWIQRFVPRLYDPGEVTHAWLGASVRTVAGGMELTYVISGSPAARAGLEAGDVLFAINGQQTNSIAVAQEVLLDRLPGALVELGYRRGREENSAYVQLDERPFSPFEDAAKIGFSEDLLLPLFGMQVTQTERTIWRRSFVVDSVIPGSVADESGIGREDPFTLLGWQYDDELDVVLLRILVQKRDSGFMESGLQLGAFIRPDNIL